MITPQITSELNGIAEKLKASTVEISSTHGSSGSGTIWRSQGLIVTNAHVIQGWQTNVTLADGKVLNAKVTAIEPQRDLAALQVDATDLPAITVGNANNLRVGELVLAVGNPLGIAGALTMGVIHTIDWEEIEEIKETKRYPKKSLIPSLQSQKWVIADIRLAPGNSGGLLANAKGEVIGINTAIAGGLALAIPSQEVDRFLDLPHRLTLGVTMRPVFVPLNNGYVLGWVVLDVAFGSLAMAASLVKGDVIISLNERYFRTADELTYFLANIQPKSQFTLGFLRDRKLHEQTIVVGDEAT